MQLMEELVNQEVNGNLEQARQRMKKWYDIGKIISNIQQGELILLKKQVKKRGLERQFKGPYQVLQRNGPTVKINYAGRGNFVTKWVHLNRCKGYTFPFQEDPSTGNLDTDVASETNYQIEESEIPSTDIESIVGKDSTNILEYQSEAESTLSMPADTPRKSNRNMKIPERFRNSGWPKYFLNHHQKVRSNGRGSDRIR